jgi:DUF1365 family protein
VSLQSAIFIGRVRHRRRDPVHEFSFPLFMVYLDLAELDRVFSLTRWWGRSRWRPAEFRDGDYLPGSGSDLAGRVRGLVHEQTGREPAGPIRMLTQLRTFGHIFNPVTFFYCFDAAGRELECVVAEITNTPWKERHAYVLPVGRGTCRQAGPAQRPVFRWQFGKQFHVSPLMPMELEYDWSFNTPADDLLVHMNLLHREGGHGKAFDATLTLERREMTPGRMRGMLVRFPLMTLQIIAKIHFEALRTWLKGAPVHAHPAAAPSHGVMRP